MNIRRSRRISWAIAAFGALTFLLFIAIFGLETTGRDLLVIGIVRTAFAAALVAATGHTAPGRGVKAGRALAVIGAVLTVMGALIHVAVDGWAFNPFTGGGDPPVYAFVIGLGAMAFAVGAITTGIAALRGDADRPVSILLLLGGLLYLPAIPLAAAGHVLWAMPWLALGARLLTTPRNQPRADTAPIASATSNRP